MGRFLFNRLSSLIGVDVYCFLPQRALGLRWLWCGVVAQWLVGSISMTFVDGGDHGFGDACVVVA